MTVTVGIAASGILLSEADSGGASEGGGLQRTQRSSLEGVVVDMSWLADGVDVPMFQLADGVDVAVSSLAEVGDATKSERSGVPLDFPEGPGRRMSSR